MTIETLKSRYIKTHRSINCESRLFNLAPVVYRRQHEILIRVYPKCVFDPVVSKYPFQDYPVHLDAIYC